MTCVNYLVRGRHTLKSPIPILQYRYMKRHSRGKLNRTALGKPPLCVAKHSSCKNTLTIDASLGAPRSTVTSKLISANYVDGEDYPIAIYRFKYRSKGL